ATIDARAQSLVRYVVTGEIAVAILRVGHVLGDLGGEPVDVGNVFMHLDVGCRELLHGAGDMQQLHAGLFEVAHHLPELFRRAVHHTAGLLHVGIDFAIGFAGVADQGEHGRDVVGDFAGGLVDPFGQGAHFIGYHREAASGFTHARRFD